MAVAGIDYKALMSEEVDVIDVLSPCLTLGNITNVAKLAKQIPDRVCWTVKIVVAVIQLKISSQVCNPDITE